jgi:general secretion pathway protein H
MDLQVVMVRTLTSTTGIKSRGFTLVEIVAALTIVGLVLAVAVPQSIRFYESVQFRAAVRETITLLNSARYSAVASGVPQDVVISPREGFIRFAEAQVNFDSDVEIAAHSAKEVNRNGLGVIRFYHDGGASGGGIDITRDGGYTVKIAVDWLVGRVDVDFGREDA